MNRLRTVSSRNALKKWAYPKGIRASSIVLQTREVFPYLRGETMSVCCVFLMLCRMRFFSSTRLQKLLPTATRDGKIICCSSCFCMNIPYLDFVQFLRVASL